MARKLHWPILIGMTAAALTVGVALGKENERNRSRFDYTIGLWGDLPYSDLQATVGVPNLIADMNDSDIEFSINDGDLKVGSGVPGSSTPTTCSNAMYDQALGYLNSLKKPAILTPGDNDWTDCDRPANGGFNSLERLDHERDVFFSTPFSLGKQRLRLEVQSSPTCLGAQRRPGLRRKSPLDLQGHHLRHLQRPGLMQQPVRYRSRSGRVRGAERGEHRVAPADLRRGESKTVERGHAGLASRSRLRRQRCDPRAVA